MTQAGTAIVPFEGPEALQPDGTPFPSRGALHLPALGIGVYAFLALASFDRRTRVAAYALRVVNGTGEPVLCNCYAVHLNGVTTSVYPAPLVAAANGVMDTAILVHAGQREELSRLAVDVVGRNGTLRVEAPAPARAARALPLLGWGAAALLFLAIVVGALLWSAPRIAVFEPPTNATVGSALEIPYALGGLASLQYDLRDDGGRVLAADTLGSRVGVLRIPWPKGGAQGPLSLRLRAIGPLGSDVRSATIALRTPPRSLAAPASGSDAQGAVRLIGSLSVTPTPVRADHDVHVNYVASATGGTIWLLDLAGKVWSSADFSRHGTSLLHVPAEAAGREMKVMLQVQNGTEHASSSVDVVVAPGAAGTATVATAATADAPQGTATPADPPVKAVAPGEEAASTIELSQGRVMPGQSVDVRIIGAHDDALISLTDAHGQVIEEGDAAGAQHAVTITAPAVSVPTTFYVVASITRGVAQTSVVRRLLVAPGP